MSELHNQDEKHSPQRRSKALAITHNPDGQILAKAYVTIAVLLTFDMETSGPFVPTLKAQTD